MNRLQVLLVLAAVVALIGAALFIRPRPPQVMYLEIGGTPGVSVAGTYTVDDTQYTFTGVVPARFGFAGREVEYAISKTSEPGDLKVTLATELKGKISSSTSDEGGGCKGGMKLGGRIFRGTSAWCTTTRAPRPATQPAR